MNSALWIVQSLLALAFLAFGGMKLVRSKEELAVSMHWVKDVPESRIKLLGLAEVLGALGLILPAITKILPVLTPIAATGLLILMAGAFFTNLRLKEVPNGIVSLALVILSAAVAVGRFVGVA